MKEVKKRLLLKKEKVKITAIRIQLEQTSTSLPITWLLTPLIPGRNYLTALLLILT